MSISYRSNRDPARVRANEYFVSELICCTNKICICPNLGRISVFTTFQLSQLITQPTLVFQKTLKNQTLVYCPYSNPTLQKVCLRPFSTWVFALWSLKSSFASAKCPCAQPPIYLLTLPMRCACMFDFALKGIHIIREGACIDYNGFSRCR